MDLNTLREFTAVIREGSFAGAARALNVPKSTVSKRVADLEASLGLRLIERSTRRLRLTPDGAVVLARAERILTDADDLVRELSDRQADVAGHLRIALPVLFGQVFGPDLAAGMRRAYPLVTLDFVMTDTPIDLIEDGFDAAIRVGELPDSAQIARRFASSCPMLVAAPNLEVTLSTPNELSDDIPTLTFGPVPPKSWALMSSFGERLEVPIRPTVSMTSILALHQAALKGVGVALLPEFLIADDLAKGRLIRHLPGWSGERVNLSVLYPSAHSVTRRLRAFIDLLIDRFPDQVLDG